MPHDTAPIKTLALAQNLTARQISELLAAHGVTATRRTVQGWFAGRQSNGSRLAVELLKSAPVKASL